MRQIVNALSEGDIPGAIDIPQRNIALTLEGGSSQKRNSPMDNTGLDYRWQLYLILARLCHKVDLPIPAEAIQFQNAEQALIRRAFRQIGINSE